MFEKWFLLADVYDLDSLFVRQNFIKVPFKITEKLRFLMENNFLFRTIHIYVSKQECYTQSFVKIGQFKLKSLDQHH